MLVIIPTSRIKNIESKFKSLWATIFYKIFNVSVSFKKYIFYKLNLKIKDITQ